MDRAELLRHFHNKVVEENNPANAGEDDANYKAEYYSVAGPWDESKEVGYQWKDMVERKVSDNYEVQENLKMLERKPEDVPLVVSWGIGEWWQWELTIPLDATEPEHCTGVGSSGE